MTAFRKHPFDSRESSNDELIYDPTALDYMKTVSGTEIPQPDYCTFVSGTRHPSLADLATYTGYPERGAIVLPSTIPLLNDNRHDPLSRRPVYGVDLVFPSWVRATHTVVFGPTGAGKNVTVLDPLRFWAICDPTQSVVTFSLKASDCGLVKTLCDMTGKRHVVVNLNDPWRSVGWNPLATKDPDVAFDQIRRFADSITNPGARDSEFWNQWIKTGLNGAWLAGYRSFPAMYNLFALSCGDLIKELQGHENASSRQLAAFLEGRGHNAESVLASIIGAMTPFISDNVMRVMSKDELKLDQLFSESVCLHVEMWETSLETLRVLYQMFARSVFDEQINNAERARADAHPVTDFCDDLPSLGPVFSPERLVTMRSRGIGVVAGVQTMSSLELAYGNSSRALIDNFHNKIVLPGGPASDAVFFSHASGEQMIALPTYEGQDASFATRPLLSAAAIRTPSYSHPLFGQPATLMLGALTFQAYLQRSYEHPSISAVMRASKGITGRERLRSKRLPRPKQESPPPVVHVAAAGISNTAGWSEEQVRKRLDAVRIALDWANTTGAALEWWQQFEQEYQHRVRLVLRTAEELAIRKATITEFFLAYSLSNTDNIQANLHFLEYTRLKKAEEARKRQLAIDPSGIVSTTSVSGVTVVLSSCGDRRADVVKALKHLTGLSMSGARQLVKQAPTIVGRCETEADAREAIRKISEAGGVASVEK